MKKISLNNILTFLPKTNIKAGEGKLRGPYAFYTSSPKQKLFYDEALFSGKSIILGTGGDHPSIHYTEREFTTSTDCLVAKAISKDFSLNFVYYYLYSNLHVLAKGFRGSRLKHLSEKFIRKIEIPVLPLEQQNIIVEILNKIQLTIDKRKKTLELCDEIIKAVFIEMFGDPVSTKGSRKVLLSKLGNWQSGGTPSRRKPKYFDGGTISWYTSGELNDVFISKSHENITMMALSESSAKKIEKGSLLIGMYDTAALKSSITMVDSSCNQAIAFAKLDDKKCNTLFVYFAVQLSKSYYLNKRRGARQKNLNLSMIKNIQIPLPDISLQKDFADKALFQLQLKVKLESSHDKIETLLQSTMQKAFAGELLVKEEMIFEDLLKGFSLEDFTSNKARVNYLTNLLNTHSIEQSENYEIAQKILFQLLQIPEMGLKQQYNSRKKKLELTAI